MAIKTNNLEQGKLEESSNIEKVFFRPIVETSWRYYTFVAILSIIVIIAVIAYAYQITYGLIVTDMRDQVSWGIYMANFVFFIGISHAGTFISAVLRVSGADWRHPITRMSELITAFGLFIGVSMVLIDMGRIDRILNVVFLAKLQSPILWDFFAISSYLAGSLLYTYICLIPDIATLRDRLGPKSGWFKRNLWRGLALGWTGTENQRRRLNRGIIIMAWLIIPVMVSVHTVVSWIFGMLLRPGWRSTVFAPYFVVGALYSGIAFLLMIMAIFRVVYPEMREFLTDKHFQHLALLLFILTLGYFWFTISDYLNTLYSTPTEEYELLEALFFGEYAFSFWIAIGGGIILPGIILGLSKTKSVHWTLIASVLITVGMWVKRYVIIVPSMARPLVSGALATYNPTLIEWLITLGSFAALILGFTLFIKFFPLSPIWEMEEEKEKQDAIKIALAEISSKKKKKIAQPKPEITGEPI